MPKKDKRTVLKYEDKSTGQPELLSLFQKVKKILAFHVKGNFIVKTDKPGAYEIYYGKEVSHKGKKYPELCFASLLVQKGYVGFYFFPIYVDPKLTGKLPAVLLGTLKGKTCFHIKKDEPVLLEQIRDSLAVGREYYFSRGWK